MNTFIEKLGTYQIMTNLLPGAFFCIMIRYLFRIELPMNEIATLIAIYYFVGLVINRIGSLIIEPLLRKTRFLQFASHIDYVLAQKSNGKLEVLSETNNFFRSLLTGTVLLPIVWLVKKLYADCVWFSVSWMWLALIALFVIFLLSYQKQTSYIANHVNASLGRNEKTV